MVTIDIDAFAELKASIGKLAEQLDFQNKRIQKLASKVSQPVFYQYTDNVIISNGFGVVRLTGPDQGHIWYVTELVVGGLSPTTVAAGRADVFVSAADHRTKSALNQFILADWRDQAPALPSIAFYSPEQMTLRFNEELYVAFSNATNGQQYVATAHVTDYEEGALAIGYAL